VIFFPSGLARILVKVLGADVMMLTTDHAAKGSEIAFSLIGANALRTVCFTVIDSPGFLRFN